LLEGPAWLFESGEAVHVTGKSGLAQAFGRRAASRGASASPPTSSLSLVAIGGCAKAEPI
jgi:hypothetical protein